MNILAESVLLVNTIIAKIRNWTYVLLPRKTVEKEIILRKLITILVSISEPNWKFKKL